VRLRELGGQVRRHLRDPGLLCLFGLAFLLMSAFVTVYNYLGFRLLRPPFLLPATLVALIFLGYVAGSWASTAAGRLGDRFGRRTVLWVGLVVGIAGIGLTGPAWLPGVLAGLVLVTVGFFAAHSLASGWVGRRAALLPQDGAAAAGRRCCRGARLPSPRRCTCRATTRAAASAERSAGWCSTARAGAASSGTSPRCWPGRC
jgi:MFS transporter, YNFM family, putative membrane transport protein